MRIAARRRKLLPYSSIGTDEWLWHLHSADAVIAFMPDRIGEDDLAQCKRLKLISSEYIAL
jgi:hypothetical protein